MPGNLTSLWAKQLALLQAVRARITAAHPDHRAIARGMIWVSLFVVLGGLARAAKEIVIAWRYGISPEVDAYLFVYNVAIWPVGVWFSVLTVVLVPLAARLRRGEPAELARFRAELFGLTVVVAVVGYLAIAMGLRALLKSPWTGLQPLTVSVAADSVIPLSLLVPLGMVVSLFSAWMLSAGRHVNTLLEGVPALVILGVLLIIPGANIEPLVWATVAGFAFHMVSVGVPLATRHEIGVPSFSFSSPHWQWFWRGFGIMSVGQALMSFTGILDQFFAANLGEGAIATLGFANRVLSLILSIGAMAISRATLPVFSRAQAEERTAIKLVAKRWVRIAFVLGTLFLFGSWPLTRWIVEMLFQRGAFTAYDTAVVSDVLRYGLFQIPFYFAGLVLISLLASAGRHHVIALIAACGLLVKVIAMLIVVPMMKVNGIAFATAVMYAFTLSLLAIAVMRPHGRNPKVR